MGHRELLESYARELARWKRHQEYKARTERPTRHEERQPGETTPCPVCNVRIGACLLRGWWGGTIAGIVASPEAVDTALALADAAAEERRRLSEALARRAAGGAP